MSDVVKHYEYLHSIPEGGFHETKTAAYLTGKLQEAGYAVTGNLGGTTGLVAEYDSGVPGPVLGLRSDMDALAHVIDGKTVYKHSCGHDGHMSMLLTTAEESMREGLVRKGRIKFIFQSAEELGTGALRILDSGVIDDLDILLGMHIRPAQECPAGSIVCAMRYSATCVFEAYIEGVPAHGARPHLGVNAIDAGVNAVVGVNAIHMDPRVPFSVKCTRFIADAGAFNAIPDHAGLCFDMRAQTNEVMQGLKEKTLAAIESGAASNGARVSGYEYYSDLPAGDNPDPELQKLIEKCAGRVVGPENVIPTLETSGGEDFFVYTVNRKNIKSCFIGLGAGAEPGLHHPQMHFDTKYLENGILLYREIIKELME